MTVSGRRGEAGQVLVLAAVALTVLMLAAGLGIDMGYLRYQRRRMQTAADSAAIAAATQLGGDYTGAATTDASLNGFSSSNGATVTVTQPVPLTCPDGTANCAQVQISQPQQVFFMNILGSNLSPVVSTVATAEQVPGLGCAYALSNANDAVMVGYNSLTTLVVGSTCAFVDNGALNIESLNSSHLVKTQSIAVGIPYTGNLLQAIPAPVYAPQGSGDPLATLSTPPTPSACAGTPTTYTPNCFYYPSGLTIDAGWGNVLQIKAGLYTVGGAGLTIGPSGGGIVTFDPNTGSGVTFYVTGGGSVNVNNGTPPNSPLFTYNGYSYGTQVELQAPLDTSSGIPGVLIFQDRNDTQPANIALWGDSNSADNSYLWGAIYTPSATLTLTGLGYGNIDFCSSTPRFTTVVASKLVFQQNINFSTNDCNNPYSSVATPVSSPNRNAVLVQ